MTRFALRNHRALCAFLPLVAVAATSAVAHAQVSVLTQHNDNLRTGGNTHETILTTANVNPAHFGKLFAIPADGEIYTQPLYVPNVPIPGKGAHNVVYFATMSNSVYAVDADTGARYWCLNFGPPIPAADVQYVNDISLNVGILGTPVIDPATSRIYFVNCTKFSDGTYHQFLNALNITTGAPVAGSPREILATSNGITFDAAKQNPRPAVTLANGNVYLAWSSHNDIPPYHGWVMAYRTTDLTQVATYIDTPNPEDTLGGIWMSGQGLTVDSSGNVYFASGNGSFGAAGTQGRTITATGNSYVKLSPSLQLLDWFTPHDSDVMNSYDADLGSCGLLGVPGTQAIIGGSKYGILYVVDNRRMGKYNSSSDQIVQEIQGVYGNGSSHIHGAPIYYNSPVHGPSVYVWGENDTLRAYAFTPALEVLNPTPFATSTMTAPMSNANGAMPGGFLSISSNNNAAKTGIVWASTPYDSNANNAVAHGVLHAFDADTLNEIWTDKTNNPTDDIGRFAKFCPPTIANGRVYIPNFGPLGAADGSGQLAVYGLLPSAGTSIDVGGAAAGAFAADADFSGGTVGSLPAATAVDTSGLVVPPPVAVYHSWRIGTPQAGFSYTVPGLTPLTSYRVRLHFIEPTATATGQRRFNVAANGLTVLRSFDILLTAGGRRDRAVVEQFNATSTAAGTIALALTPVAGAPILCGIEIAPVTTINYNTGFESAADLTFNGSAKLAKIGPAAQVTDDGGNEAGSIFTTKPQNITSFQTNFTFQVLNPLANGFTFAVQGNGPSAVGGNAANLGYGGMQNSVAIKFDLANNASSTGLFVDGAEPTVPSTDLLKSGIDLHSGHVFNATLSYNGINLTFALQDTSNQARFTASYPVNIPAKIGGPYGYVGFTGGTSGAGAEQDIQVWSFTGNPRP